MAVVFHEGLKFYDGDHTDMWLILEIAFSLLVWWQDYESGFHFHVCGIITQDGGSRERGVGREEEGSKEKIGSQNSKRDY